jgi:hypothetical protein
MKVDNTIYPIPVYSFKTKERKRRRRKGGERRNN